MSNININKLKAIISQFDSDVADIAFKKATELLKKSNKKWCDVLIIKNNVEVENFDDINTNEDLWDKYSIVKPSIKKIKNAIAIKEIINIKEKKITSKNVIYCTELMTNDNEILNNVYFVNLSDMLFLKENLLLNIKNSDFYITINDNRKLMYASIVRN